MILSDKPHKRPNVLLIVVDCLRADRCPLDPDDPYNENLCFWPDFRKSSTCFSQMISTASVTPVCFASIFSGQYSFTHGIRTIKGPGIHPKVPTLATVLKEQGYHTHGFLTGPLSPIFGLDQGFDTYECRERKQNIYTQWGDELFEKLPAIFNTPPALVVLHLFELHYPRAVQKRKVHRRSAKRYDYAWWELNEQLAKIMELVPDHTITLLTADHGERLFRPSDKTPWGYLYRKLRKKLKLPRRTCDGRDHGFHIFDDLIRIPLAVHGPKLPRGKIIDQQVCQVDIMPTILDLLHIEKPMATNGRPLVPLIESREQPEKSVFLETGNTDLWRSWRGLRFHQWKYAEQIDTQTQTVLDFQLYNLREDPTEHKNVAPLNRDLLTQMKNDIQTIIQDNPMGPDAGGRELTPEEQNELNEKLKALGYL
ncbi:MAG: sulfatase-like hydrolase/transferase [Sedimentisphaerales bacterium]|nr:sulfatase-like hydrolase/transferase [Sedimentisphaerales bacterium]